MQLKLPIGEVNDTLPCQDRYFPCSDDGSFVRSFMGLVVQEDNSCVLGGSCAGWLQCRRYDKEWPRQPQDIDIYTSYPEDVNLHKLVGRNIGCAKVTRAECKHYSPVVTKGRCCTWWIHLEEDGQQKKLEVDIKEAHEDTSTRYEEVNSVPCLTMKDLSRYLVYFGAKTVGNYRHLDLQAFQNIGVDLALDNSPLIFRGNFLRRSSSFDSFQPTE